MRSLHQTKYFQVFGLMDAHGLRAEDIAMILMRLELRLSFLAQHLHIDSCNRSFKLDSMEICGCSPSPLATPVSFSPFECSLSTPPPARRVAEATPARSRQARSHLLGIPSLSQGPSDILFPFCRKSWLALMEQRSPATLEIKLWCVRWFSGWLIEIQVVRFGRSPGSQMFYLTGTTQLMGVRDLPSTFLEVRRLGILSSVINFDSQKMRAVLAAHPEVVIATDSTRKARSRGKVVPLSPLLFSSFSLCRISGAIRPWWQTCLSIQFPATSDPRQKTSLIPQPLSRLGLFFFFLRGIWWSLFKKKSDIFSRYRRKRQRAIPLARVVAAEHSTLEANLSSPVFSVTSDHSASLSSASTETCISATHTAS